MHMHIYIQTSINILISNLLILTLQLIVSLTTHLCHILFNKMPKQTTEQKSHIMSLIKHKLFKQIQKGEGTQIISNKNEEGDRKNITNSMYNSNRSHPNTPNASTHPLTNLPQLLVDILLRSRQYNRLQGLNYRGSTSQEKTVKGNIRRSKSTNESGLNLKIIRPNNSNNNNSNLSNNTNNNKDNNKNNNNNKDNNKNNNKNNIIFHQSPNSNKDVKSQQSSPKTATTNFSLINLSSATDNRKQFRIQLLKRGVPSQLIQTYSTINHSDRNGVANNQQIVRNIMMTTQTNLNSHNYTPHQSTSNLTYQITRHIRQEYSKKINKTNTIHQQMMVVQEIEIGQGRRGDRVRNDGAGCNNNGGAWKGGNRQAENNRDLLERYNDKECNMLQEGYKSIRESMTNNMHTAQKEEANNVNCLENYKQIEQQQNINIPQHQQLNAQKQQHQFQQQQQNRSLTRQSEQQKLQFQQSPQQLHQFYQTAPNLTDKWADNSSSRGQDRNDNQNHINYNSNPNTNVNITNNINTITSNSLRKHYSHSNSPYKSPPSPTILPHHISTTYVHKMFPKGRSLSSLGLLGKNYQTCNVIDSMGSSNNGNVGNINNGNLNNSNNRYSYASIQHRNKHSRPIQALTQGQIVNMKLRGQYTDNITPDNYNPPRTTTTSQFYNTVSSTSPSPPTNTPPLITIYTQNKFLSPKTKLKFKHNQHLIEKNKGLIGIGWLGKKRED